MTPKENAKELFEKYFNIIDNSHPLTDINISAKQCALIAVDEIEKALTDYGSGDSLQLQNMDSEFRYWEQVKNEIEKL